MRTLYAGYDEVFDNYLEAVRDRRRARVRREAINLTISVGRNKQYWVVGDSIVGPWSCRRAKNGKWRTLLYGYPVRPPRPKGRKGKQSKILYIRWPMFPR